MSLRGMHFDGVTVINNVLIKSMNVDEFTNVIETLWEFTTWNKIANTTMMLHFEKSSVQYMCVTAAKKNYTKKTIWN